jgi:chromosome partitioning protein
MTRTLTICNQKGGQGRTTTTVTLGHGLAMAGKQVLLVDADPQGQVATFLGLRQESGFFDLLVEKRPLADVVRSADTNVHHRPGLQVIPGNKRTATAQVVLGAKEIKLDCLARALKGVKVDYVICDTSPFVGLLQEAAIFAANWLLVPCAVDYAAIEGLAGTLDTLQAVRDRGGQCQLLGVIPTFYDEVTRESEATLTQLKDRLKEIIWQPIHRATTLRECAAEAVTIFEKAPRSRAADEYTEVVRRVLRYE